MTATAKYGGANCPIGYCLAREECPHPPPIRCLGTGEYVPWGWQRWPCPECRAMVWRDPDTLGLVEHSPGDAGEPPEESV